MPKWHWLQSALRWAWLADFLQMKKKLAKGMTSYDSLKCQRIWPHFKRYLPEVMPTIDQSGGIGGMVFKSNMQCDCFKKKKEFFIHLYRLNEIIKHEANIQFFIWWDLVDALPHHEISLCTLIMREMWLKRVRGLNGNNNYNKRSWWHAFC